MDVLDEAKESKKVVRTLYKNMYEDKGSGALVYINTLISKCLQLLSLKVYDSTKDGNIGKCKCRDVNDINKKKHKFLIILI